MRVLRLLFVFCFFLILAAIETFPLIFRLRTHVCDPYDPLMLTWVLAWDVHALAQGNLLHLFDANIFYPVERSLAFSEHMLGVLPIFAPVYLWTGNPVLGHNVVLVLSFVLSGLGMFCLADHWTRQFWPSLVAATLFGFAAYRFQQLAHLQLLNFFWAPVALLFLDRFLRTRRWRDLIGFATFYWLQVLSSVYLGYMLTVGVVLYASYFVLVVDRGLLRFSMLVKTLAFVGASIGVLLPLHLPYMRVQESWGFVRDIPEIMFFAPDALNYFSAPRFMNELYQWLFRGFEPTAEGEKLLFPGLVLPVLVALGSFGKIDGVSSAIVRPLRHALWLALAAALVLSLGPYLILFGVRTGLPLPYLLLYRLVPGFTAMRVPGRFVLLALLVASPLAALGAIKCAGVVSRLLKSRRRFAPQLAALGLIGLFLLELGWRPLPLVAAPGDEHVRALHRWLRMERPGPIVELPFSFADDYGYVYFTTAHWLPLVNGLSSFAPSVYDEIELALKDLPNPSAVEYARALGIRAIVVHTESLSWVDVIRWSDEATGRGGLKKVATFGTHDVYAVPPISTSPSLSVETSVPPWVPAGKPVRLGLRVRADSSGPWRHPGPHGWLNAMVEWTDSRTGRSLKVPAQFQLPPVVPAGMTLDLPPRHSVAVPDVAGAYTFRVSIPVPGVTSDPRTVEVRNTNLPTSLDAPRLLAASYSPAPIDGPRVTTGEEPIRVEIGVTNVGAALWLAKAHRERGEVRLGWRWLRNDQELQELSGRKAIPYDVFPGQQARLVLSIQPPQSSGNYTLELGLVSELITQFADVGSPSLRLGVEVRAVPDVEVGAKADIEFARLVERLRLSEPDAPRLTLSAGRVPHRAGERIQLTIELRESRRPWIVDAYLVLAGPRGTIRFYDGQRLVALDQNRWTLLGKSVRLPVEKQPPLVASVPLAGLEPGIYTWYLLVTESGGRRILADARARMQVVR